MEDTDSKPPPHRWNEINRGPNRPNRPNRNNEPRTAISRPAGNATRHFHPPHLTRRFQFSRTAAFSDRTDNNINHDNNYSDNCKYSIERRETKLMGSIEASTTLPVNLGQQEQQPQPQPQATTCARSVRFQLIELIEIAIVLGDYSPSLSSGGPPMSLGWEALRRTELDLDHYEQYRPKRKESRRDLIISGKRRTSFFLRCGYSMSEIEEAAALSLNYRKQMTLTKIMEAPEQMKDAVKNRFASTQEPEHHHSQRHRISRRHSMEPLRPPRREPEVDYHPHQAADTSTSLGSRSQHSDGPSMPSQFVMPRGRSKTVSRQEEQKQHESIESDGPWRAATTNPKKLERQNSPTAEPSTSPIPRVSSPKLQLRSLVDQSLPQLPSRTFSPESEKRNNLRRHKSAPLSKFQGLKMPVRTVSPVPPSSSKLVLALTPTDTTTRTSSTSTMGRNYSHSRSLLQPSSKITAPAAPRRAISPEPSPSSPPRLTPPPSTTTTTNLPSDVLPTTRIFKKSGCLNLI